MHHQTFAYFKRASKKLFLTVHITG